MSSDAIVECVYAVLASLKRVVSSTLFGHFNMLVGYISFSPNNHGRIFWNDFLAQGNLFDVPSIYSFSNAASIFLFGISVFKPKLQTIQIIQTFCVNIWTIVNFPVKFRSFDAHLIIKIDYTFIHWFINTCNIQKTLCKLIKHLSFFCWKYNVWIAHASNISNERKKNFESKTVTN